MDGRWQWLLASIGPSGSGKTETTTPLIPPEPTHPYYPPGVSIPAYAANEAPVPVLLAALGGTLGFAVLGAALVARKFNPGLSASGLAVFCWFVMSKRSPALPLNTLPLYDISISRQVDDHVWVILS
jgi:hypothetical protein